MEKFITLENLRSFAYVNDAICQKPIRGIVISFMGLGVKNMYWEDIQEGKYYAERGILYMVPYLNPWSWMNPQAVRCTDEILDVLYQAYDLPENLPVVSTGGSMGGQQALAYMAYAKRTPVACVTNCPVCDVPYHFTERPDLPRTMYSAFYWEEGDLQSAMERYSPLHLAEKLPKVPYYVFHCTADLSVNLEMHSQRFVERMQAAGHAVTFHLVPDRGHCELTEEMWELYWAYAAQAIESAK